MKDKGSDDDGNDVRNTETVGRNEAMFPGSSQAAQAEVDNNDKDNQNMPLTTERQQIPIIKLEPHNSGNMPQHRVKTSQLQPIIIPATLPALSQTQVQTIPSHNQQHGQQQVLHNASVHRPISLPHAPPMH